MPHRRKKPRDKIQRLFGRTHLGKDLASEQGDPSKVIVSDRKIKVKGPKGKYKIKYNKDGTIKKRVTRIGGKRRVDKPKRDKRKSFLNVLRNRRDERKY